MDSSPDPLSPEVHQFVNQSIASIVALEMLLHLRRSPETYWMPAAIASAIGATEALVIAAGNQLAERALIARGRETGGFRYAPASAADREVVDALAEAFEHQRVAVLDVVYGSGARSVNAFADAFRFRR